jgi:hypothetical protein
MCDGRLKLPDVEDPERGSDDKHNRGVSPEPVRGFGIVLMRLGFVTNSTLDLAG